MSLWAYKSLIVVEAQPDVKFRKVRMQTNIGAVTSHISANRHVAIWRLQRLVPR